MGELKENILDKRRSRNTRQSSRQVFKKTRDLKPTVLFHLALGIFRPLNWFILGIKYYKGEGVAQDFAKAARWFLQAAKRGEVAAQFALVLMHYEGKGMEQDSVETAQSYRHSAEQRMRNTQNNLGLMFFSGE